MKAKQNLFSIARKCMQGKIIKGIAGFYYVHNFNHGIFECKAKGVFRNKNIKPLVGDNVQIEILNEDDKIGNIVEVMQRKNELIRPAAANIDQALVIFSLVEPDPNVNLLDRFLIVMESQGVPCIICFNKTDLDGKDEVQKKVENIYKNAGYVVRFCSTLNNSGISEIHELLKDKTTILAGPSGVGKSSLLNSIIPDANSQTGTLSEKIKRGKHTTRHTEIFNVSGDTYILDTPGFSSIFVEIEKEDLWKCFPEFREFEPYCKFAGCAHISEPGCGILEALEKGNISKSRYNNYLQIYKEIKERKKY